jgi:hypothetical protein
MSTPVLDTAAAAWRAGDYDDLGFLVDLTGNGHDAQLGSDHIARISTDYDGVQCLRLPGTASNYCSVGDSAALDIVGDIDIQCLVSLADWTPAAVNALVTKLPAAGNYSYGLYMQTNGKFVIFWSEDGTALKNEESSVVSGITDGAKQWVRVTLDVNDGAGDATATFYLGGSGATPSWSQLGTAQKVGATTSIFSGNGAVQVGAVLTGGTTYPAKGNIYRAIIYADLTETDKRLDVDFTAEATGTTSFTEGTGKTVTVNQSGADTSDPTYYEPDGWVSYADPGTQYLRLPGSAGNYASTPDAAAYDITSDIDIQVLVAMDDWTPSAAGSIIAREAFGDKSWWVQLNTSGTIAFYWTEDGSTARNKASSTTPTVVNGDRLWVRVAFDEDNGSGGADVFFYTGGSGDTPSWSQLGTTQTYGSNTSIHAGSLGIGVGAASDGDVPIAGKFYRAIIKNGIDGTVVFDADFTDRSNVVEPYATFTESQGATVTINRSATGAKSQIVDQPRFELHTDDYFEIADHADLDFGASDSFTVMVKWRHYGTVTNGLALLQKGNPTRYYLAEGAANTIGCGARDGTDLVAASGAVNTAGVARLTAGVRVPGVSGTLESWKDGVGNGTVDASAVGDTSSDLPLRIGADSTPANFGDFEFIGAAIFRSALTPAEIITAGNELQGIVAAGGRPAPWGIAYNDIQMSQSIVSIP